MTRRGPLPFFDKFYKVINQLKMKYSMILKSAGKMRQREIVYLFPPPKEQTWMACGKQY